MRSGWWPRSQDPAKPTPCLPIDRGGVTSGLDCWSWRGKKGSLARDGGRERHVPAGPVSGEDGRQNSNSRGAGGARGGAAGPPGRADVSGGSGRQRTPIREEWWCQAGGPTLRRGGGPPATTRDATRGVRLSEIQRMQERRWQRSARFVQNPVGHGLAGSQRSSSIKSPKQRP